MTRTLITTTDGSRLHGNRTRFGPLSQLLIAVAAVLLAACALALVSSKPVAAVPPGVSAPDCATGVDFLGFSDVLNKRTFEGTSVGGLSGLTYDQRRKAYYSIVDNGPAASSPARFYTLRLPL